MPEAPSNAPVDNVVKIDTINVEDCTETSSLYRSTITELSTDKSDLNKIINDMGNSLAELDPNTENGEEGKALIRKMYKLKGIEAEETIPKMPYTPDQCVEKVAGKVL